jgi:hypothetical protein
VFNINVAKIRVTLPPQIRQMLERPINELCAQADDRYRKASRHASATQPPAPILMDDELLGDPGSLPTRSAVEAGITGGSDVGLALRAAAMQAGEYDAFQRMVEVLRQLRPELVRALRLDE